MHANTPLTAPAVVLTGASSGIGRATAHAFARLGARLVLAARSGEALETVAAECIRNGAESLSVVTDVTDDVAVYQLASKAIAHFGGIDVWINNVGVGAVGRFDEVPIEAHRRVIEANLIGHMNGAHAALTHFRSRGRGTLINMISLGGWLSSPYAAAYTASKFALRGFGQSLRAELADSPDIHVCDVYPGFVDTPGVSHGANYTGHTLRPFPPLLSAETVAARIVSLVRAPRPTVAVGTTARAARYGQSLAPELRGRLMKKLLDKALSRGERASASNGNLFEMSRGHAISGGYRKPATAALLGISVVGVGALLWHSLRKA
jgi:short-subunit dehydrogenase